MGRSLFAELGQQCVLYGGIITLACEAAIELIPQDIEDKTKWLCGLVLGGFLFFCGLVMMCLGAFDYL